MGLTAGVKFCAFHDVAPTKGETGRRAAKVLSEWGRTVLLAHRQDEWPLARQGSASMAIVAGFDTFSLGIEGDTRVSNIKAGNTGNSTINSKADNRSVANA